MARANCGRKSLLRGTGKRVAGPMLLALATCLSCPQERCEAADVAVSIHLDADSVEIIRGLRRANGIDPPDSAADQRLAQILETARVRRREQPVAARLPAKLPLVSARYARADSMRTAMLSGDIARTVNESRSDASAHASRKETGGCYRYSSGYP